MPLATSVRVGQAKSLVGLERTHSTVAVMQGRALLVTQRAGFLMGRPIPRAYARHQCMRRPKYARQPRRNVKTSLAGTMSTAIPVLTMLSKDSAVSSSDRVIIATQSTEHQEDVTRRKLVVLHALTQL